MEVNGFWSTSLSIGARPAIGSRGMKWSETHSNSKKWIKKNKQILWERKRERKHWLRMISNTYQILSFPAGCSHQSWTYGSGRRWRPSACRGRRSRGLHGQWLCPFPLLHEGPAWLCPHDVHDQFVPLIDTVQISLVGPQTQKQKRYVFSITYCI